MSDEAERRPGGPGCVLVVEDDLLLRRIVVKILEDWGFAIIEAADGRVALDRLRESGDRMTVVLLDVMLPRVHGVEVARAIGDARPDLPIVACSAALNDGIITELRQVGVRHFLLKPYAASDLRAALDVAMGRRVVGEVRPANPPATPPGPTVLPLRMPPFPR